MAFTLTNMGIKVWDQPSDHFSYQELQANWTAIDTHDHTTGKGVPIPTGGIANLAVTLAKLADNSVGTTKIVDAAVTTAKIPDNAVITAKLPDNAVTTAKIPDNAVTLQKLAAAVAQTLIPTATVLPWGGAAGSPPTGFLVCQGQAVSRTTYAALYAVLGTAFGTGDGSTTFNLPDAQGRSLIGAGTGSGLTNRVLGTKGGEENHLLSTTEMPSHSHSIADPGHLHGFSGGATALNAGGGYNAFSPGSGVNVGTTTQTSSATTGITINSTGGGAVHNNMQPWLAINYIIKT